jgi:hypothetical protein
MDLILITEADLPPFNIAHITNYFISRVACDGKSTKDFKNLNLKAFPLFKDKHNGVSERAVCGVSCRLPSLDEKERHI